MATITASTYKLDFLDDSAYLSPTRDTDLYNGQYLTERTGDVYLYDPLENAYYLTLDRRRSPGDLGYGGLPVSGSIFNSGVIGQPSRTQT